MHLARAVLAAVFLPLILYPQQPPPAWSDREKPLVEAIRGLRKLPDDERATTTRRLALDIRSLPASPRKLRLASSLANLSTEGDFGRDTLQQVAETLAAVLHEQPDPNSPDLAGAYSSLAQLVRYEHVRLSIASPRFTEAMDKLAADDLRRSRAAFTLTDLTGKSWTLRDLRGKVVLVNFWATWCPPCRKEMPGLEALHKQFRNEGLVILAISDEDADKVKPYISEHKYSFPILLDPARAAHDQFSVEGIPKTFVYDREGKLVAQSIDRRTRRQFLEMLERAGLQ